MKVAIGNRLREGPWGGGNQFAIALQLYLEAHGVDVVHTLQARDIDVIVLTEPRRSSASSAFNDVDIILYLTKVNPTALVVHRINECDERKNTRMVNRRLLIANRCADCTVFISDWLRDLFERRGDLFIRPTVIRNGADRSTFHAVETLWDGCAKLRLVTHHWSGNRMKGFDIYERLDRLLEEPEYAKRFTFTYIGNLPQGFQLRHSRAYPPQHGVALAAVLGRYHVYLTASQNEPAGMHHIEGALCGLPLLYRRSGALPEYCEGFGVGFDEGSFERALLEMHARYDTFKQRMAQYPYDADRMCGLYLSRFNDLLAERDEIVAQRGWTSWTSWRMRVGAALYDQRYTWRLRMEESWEP